LKSKVLLITPPFTQLNTPYPATAYLKGFLNTKNINSFQADLGIEVILELFSKKGLKEMFSNIMPDMERISENSSKIFKLKEDYIYTIDSVIQFLQGKNPSLAYRICENSYLPEASRFKQLDDLEWAFGSMGIQDKAKHLATLYLEDIGDFITECIDPHFGFSRYAERLGRSANSFDELYDELNSDNTFIDNILTDILEQKVRDQKPNLVALSVPFPGNLYSAFKCAQWIKKQHPEIKIAFGGGFANTELRSLKEPRVFEYVDFVCLDDGELPLFQITKFLEGFCAKEDLKRTFFYNNGKLEYSDNSLAKDFSQDLVGTPDYSDLLLDKYISVIEIVNPMHRLWSDGRWNKLTLAHGCYWAQCSFCDTSLDYINRYEPNKAKIICDRIEEIVKQTGQTGFHFVDEAAPPAILRELALELLRRKISITWWTNIRFEKKFTKDLCRLMAASGCIAVSGGLEVASDRLLKIINKGVTIKQVAQVTDYFTQAGIMVHAYLMFGFPSQTEQETIDSLEVVRQLFEQGIVQSGFWHQFAMTAHSPVGTQPAKFQTQLATTEIGTFANNDLEFKDLTGYDHAKFADGLKKSLFNFMHGIGFDFPLQDWFDFKTLKTSHSPHLIESAINEPDNYQIKAGNRIIWLGNPPVISTFTKRKKGKEIEMAELHFVNKTDEFSIKLDREKGEWLADYLVTVSLNNIEKVSYQQMQEAFNEKFAGDFQLLWFSKAFDVLRENGLLVL
jgi:radical SAM superfamily enzyme YgiQ (UPF0313 family)